MFLKKIFIFLAVVFLAVDLFLLGLYIQANNNLMQLSDSILDDTVKYYGSVGVKLDRDNIVKKVPSNKIYTFASDNGKIGENIANRLSESLFSKKADVNVFETPDGTSYTISNGGKTAASLRVYADTFGFEYVSGELTTDTALFASEPYTNNIEISKDEKKIIDNFLSALSESLKNSYKVSGSSTSGAFLTISIEQLADDDCIIQDMFLNVVISDGKVVYAKGNIILSDIVKSYSEPLYDGVNALNKVEVSTVSEFLSEKIVYTYRYSGNSVYYLVPVWKIEYVDKNGAKQIQYVDAIKN